MYLFKDENRSPFYQIIYFVNDKRKTITTGKRLKSEALKFLSNFEKNISVNKEIKIMDLDKFKEEYIGHCSLKCSSHYIRSINSSFKMLIDYCGNMELENYNTRILDKFFTVIYERSNYSAFLCYRTLKAAFSKAVTWGYLKENPIKNIKPPKVISSFPVFINPEQLNLIVNHTKKQVMKDIFNFAFHTGLRLSEIINLRWWAVDLPGMIIKVMNTDEFKTKSKKDRLIPLNSITFKILKKRLPRIISIERNELVFWLTNDVKITPDHVSKMFKKALRASSLDDKIHFHTLRHSFASNLIQKGVSLYVVKELLGHEDIKTTQIYSHLKQDNLFDAVRLLE